jgi:hypothetical protein
MRAEPQEQVEKVIREESLRLNEVEQRARLEANAFFNFLVSHVGSYTNAERLISRPDTFEQFLDLMDKFNPNPEVSPRSTLTEHSVAAKMQINTLRRIVGRPDFVFDLQ